jgi:GNAT superfamily N-acetyltransferase
VTLPEFTSRRLEDRDHLDSFASGQEALDTWLRDSARHADQMRTGRTWVWARGDDVVAYFTLAGHVIEKAALPSKLGRGSPERIPAVLIAKLALRRDLQGRGLGGVLLADACRRVVAASEIAAARLAVVDAIGNDASRFYRHFGFEPIPGTMRLVRKVSDLAQDTSGGT